MSRPGPARNTIVIVEAQARPKPAGSGPGHWPDHIVIQQKQHYYYCVRILMSRDCLVVMFTITCIFNVCVKSSMDKKPNIASRVIDFFLHWAIDFSVNQFLICIQMTYK